LGCSWCSRFGSEIFIFGVIFGVDSSPCGIFFSSLRRRIHPRVLFLLPSSVRPGPYSASTKQALGFVFSCFLPKRRRRCTANAPHYVCCSHLCWSSLGLDSLPFGFSFSSIFRFPVCSATIPTRSLRCRYPSRSLDFQSLTALRSLARDSVAAAGFGS
jgi:hypothetical protein